MIVRKRERERYTNPWCGALTRSYMLRCRFLLTPPELVSVSSLASSLTGGRSRSSCRPIFRNTLVDMVDVGGGVGTSVGSVDRITFGEIPVPRSGRYAMSGRRRVARVGERNGRRPTSVRFAGRRDESGHQTGIVGTLCWRAHTAADDGDNNAEKNNKKKQKPKAAKRRQNRYAHTTK